jgi:hypothetical protein
VQFAAHAIGGEPVKRLLRNQATARIVGRWLASQLEPLNDCASPDAINVLMFDAHRYKQDLQALAATQALRLFHFPQNSLFRINAIFRNRSLAANPNYFMETTSEILDLQNQHIIFLSEVARQLRAVGKIEAALSPAVHYRFEYPWAAGFDRVGLPFVVAHKEFTILDDRYLDRRIKKYRDERRRFLGSSLLVTNETARRLFERSGIFDSDLIKIVGLPRMDRLLTANSSFRSNGNRHLATMFSFGHYSGDIPVTAKRETHYFDPSYNEGFVELSREAHAAFARAALARPNISFVFKTKYPDSKWNVEINKAVKWGTGRDISEIDNLKIVNTSAPELIRDSWAVVGFNSTVVIESRVLGRPTIVPMFAEAAGRHRENVYFAGYWDLFEAVKSAEEMTARLVALVDGESSRQSDDPEKLGQFVRAYLGFDDGRSAWRIVEELRRLTGKAA